MSLQIANRLRVEFPLETRLRCRDPLARFGCESCTMAKLIYFTRSGMIWDFGGCEIDCEHFRYFPSASLCSIMRLRSPHAGMCNCSLRPTIASPLEVRREEVPT